MCPFILESINHDVKNTVFSFIPNTAEVSFYGMVKGIEDYLDEVKAKKIVALEGSATPKQVQDIISMRTRAEKIAIKDAKLRTFITQDDSRDDLGGHKVEPRTDPS